MKRPDGLKTKIFLDSGSPDDTRSALSALGFLDGQTTNPSLIAKNKDIQSRIASGEKLSREDVYDFYRGVVREISGLIPGGSVSVEVYADASTSSEEMLSQARQMYGWVDNAHIKYPTTSAGLAAAEEFVQDGGRVNMTLCFSQEQAAAVYAATSGAERGQVFVSPFIGRLDDRGENGMDLIANILRMFKAGDGHVELLSASVRGYEHFQACLALGSDIITAPLAVLEEWAGRGLEMPPEDFVYEPSGLSPMPYGEVSLDADWQSYDISHPLTDAGLEKFAEDWNGLIGIG